MAPARAGRDVDGVLVIDKPAGITSMEVVRRIRRAGGFRKVGHAGTLDPVATGVIPICIGQATRMMEHLVGGSKEYRGTVELGVETDTYDSAGETVAKADTSAIAAQDIEEALSIFKGAIEQIPPAYSAIKRDGKRMYDLARSGVEVTLEPRPVLVEAIGLERYEPPMATIFVRCGKGFYMRSLAHDLGARLGVGGNLHALERLRSGSFGLDDALSLEAAESMLAGGRLREILRAPDSVLRGLPAAFLGPRVAGLVRQGQAIPAGAKILPSRPGQMARAYGPNGEFLAIVVFDGATAQWRPQKVFSLTYVDDDDSATREETGPELPRQRDGQGPKVPRG